LGIAMEEILCYNVSNNISNISNTEGNYAVFNYDGY
jgi:hypothetical protein